LLPRGSALDPAPLVTSVYPLASVAEAFEIASQKNDGFVKAIVDPTLRP
jgi:hypothetical protein